MKVYVVGYVGYSLSGVQSRALYSGKGGSWIYACPFCISDFACKRDLWLHLRRFGLKAGLHLRLFYCAQAESELTQDVLHGGADRVVGEIAQAILDYRETCVVLDIKKVRGLV
jgi:hypothetical protein